jgi:hypothetical protein
MSVALIVDSTGSSFLDAMILTFSMSFSQELTMKEIKGKTRRILMFKLMA